MAHCRRSRALPSRLIFMSLHGPLPFFPPAFRLPLGWDIPPQCKPTSAGPNQTMNPTDDITASHTSSSRACPSLDLQHTVQSSSPQDKHASGPPGTRRYRVDRQTWACLGLLGLGSLSVSPHCPLIVLVRPYRYSTEIESVVNLPNAKSVP